MVLLLKNFMTLNWNALTWLKSVKQTENDFIGVNSGIMDHFYWYGSFEQRAIYLDTNTLE